MVQMILPLFCHYAILEFIQGEKPLFTQKHKAFSLPWPGKSKRGERLRSIGMEAREKKNEGAPGAMIIAASLMDPIVLS